jgi:hypothetical protein
MMLTKENYSYSLELRASNTNNKEIDMFRRLITLFMITALSGCGYNTLQSTDENIKASWAEVLNQYQRRADLVRIW